MKQCIRCILDENFPGISFDETGLCSFCRQAADEQRQQALKQEYREKFKGLLERHRGQGPYDVLMAYSGGKDSTYTLDIFRRTYGLRVLALTFDNAFISPFAVENISRITERLEVDHILFRPSFNLMQKIFSEAGKRDFFPEKALERASSICTACIGFVKSLVLKTALEKGIPFVGFGWSPGQAPVQSSVMQTNPRMVAVSQKGFWPRLEAVAGQDLSAYYLSKTDLARPVEEYPINVHPFAFHPYDEKAIKDHIVSLGWKETRDTDPNSTNCLLNAFANQVHMDRWGFHPYAWEIAGIVRAGGLSRKEGLAKINEPPNPILVSRVKERLGLSCKR
jgi:hypothetical protein